MKCFSLNCHCQGQDLCIPEPLQDPPHPALDIDSPCWLCVGGSQDCSMHQHPGSRRDTSVQSPFKGPFSATPTLVW